MLVLAQISFLPGTYVQQHDTNKFMLTYTLSVALQALQ